MLNILLTVLILSVVCSFLLLLLLRLIRAGRRLHRPRLCAADEIGSGSDAGSGAGSSPTEPYSVPTLFRPFVHLEDDKEDKLNVILVSHPFSRVTGKGSYQDYLDHKDKCIFIGITSYSTYPSVVANPYDDMHNPEDPVWQYDYLSMFDGWFHCFRDPTKYLPFKDAPAQSPLLLLMSESDFIDFDDFAPDPEAQRDIDFMYICPASEEQKCDDNDWIAFSKNWPLAKTCIVQLCEHGLKGVLVGRQDCQFDEHIEDKLIKTSFLEKESLKKYYNRSRLIFVPNHYDASPRILTEALCMDCRCLVFTDILGGWKYVNDSTGGFFRDETDVTSAAKHILQKYDTYSPREYYMKNHGKHNSGRILKDFLIENFKEKLNMDLSRSEYVSLKLSWS